MRSVRRADRIKEHEIFLKVSPQETNDFGLAFLVRDAGPFSSREKHAGERKKKSVSIPGEVVQPLSR